MPKSSSGSSSAARLQRAGGASLGIASPSRAAYRTCSWAASCGQAQLSDAAAGKAASLPRRSSWLTASAPASPAKTLEKTLARASPRRASPRRASPRSVFADAPVALGPTLRSEWVKKVSSGIYDYENAPRGVRADRAVALAAVARYGRDLQHAPRRLRGDRDVVLTAVKDDASALEFVHGIELNDTEFMLRAVRENFEVTRYASSDKTVVLAGIEETHRALQLASHDLQCDPDVQRAFWIKKVSSTVWNKRMREYQGAITFKEAPKAVRWDKDVTIAAVKNVGRALKFTCKSLRNDRDVVLAAVQCDGTALQFAEEDMCDEKGIAIAAVTNQGVALEFVSEDLRGDPDVVLPAVMQQGLALGHAAEECRASKSIVLPAVRQNFEAMRYADDSKKLALAAIDVDYRTYHLAAKHLQKLPIVVEAYWTKRGDKMTAVDQASLDGSLLQDADSSWTHDKDIVVAAVRSRGMMLQHAAEFLKGDKDVALAAVECEGSALQFANAERVSDKSIVVPAIRCEPLALRFASEALQKDKEAVAIAVALDGDALEYADSACKFDKDIVLAAVRSRPASLRFASKHLSNDKAIVTAAVLGDLAALKYAGEDAQNDPDVREAAGLKEGTSEPASDGP